MMKYYSKNKLFLIGMAWSLLILFSGCDLDNPTYAPEVSKVDSRLDDRSNDPYNGATAFIGHYIYLENPVEYDNITKLQITNSRESTWTWEGTELQENWNSEKGYFRFFCYSSRSPHHIPLGTYTVTIYETGAQETEFQFNVYCRGNSSLISGSVYSSHDGKTPRILNVPENFSAILSDDHLDVNFDTNDDIITDAILWYYDSGDNYLGSSSWFSDYAPVLTHGSNVYTVDVSGFPSMEYAMIALYSYNQIGTNISLYLSVSVKIGVH
jgi:hypothetical protein